MQKLPEFVVDFLKTFQKAGYEIYLVGGIVRELLLNKQIDWNLADFTTNAKPEEIQKVFPDSFYENKFGTVGVKIKNKKQELIFEVTTFRKESNYKDRRHPEKIEWAKTIEEDLSRRDFTINAMAYDGKKLVDLFEGQKHLNEKLIVAVGNPDQRFSEDALRLLRAIRFTAELGFLLEEKTRASIRKNAALIKQISSERVRDEIFKILASDHPAEGILFMRSTGLLEIIFPEIDACFQIPQKSPQRHHVYDVGTHLIMSLKHCPSKDTITRFATLLHDVVKAKTYRKDPKTNLITFYNHEMVSEKIAARIADRLKLSKKDKYKLLILVRYHQFTVSEKQTDKALRRFIRNVGKEYLQEMLNLRVGDRLGGGATETSWRLELFKKRLEEVQKEVFKITDLKINGDDVMKELKIKAGPKVGEILNKLFQQVEEGKLKNEKTILIKSLQELG